MFDMLLGSLADRPLGFSIIRTLSFQLFSGE
jgi:hypothetical protein